MTPPQRLAKIAKVYCGHPDAKSNAAFIAASRTDIPLLLSALEEALSALDDIRGIGSPEYAQSSLASEALAKIERLLAGTDPKSPKRCHHTRPLGSNYCPECGDEPKSPAFDVDVEELARKYIDSLPLQTHAARVHGGEGFLAGAASLRPAVEAVKVLVEAMERAYKDLSCADDYMNTHYADLGCDLSVDYHEPECCVARDVRLSRWRITDSLADAARILGGVE